MAVDALGNPLRVILSAGQVADIEQAAALIESQPAGFIIADKGYDKLATSFLSFVHLACSMVWLA